jgi:hypothetical protein
MSFSLFSVCCLLLCAKRRGPRQAVPVAGRQARKNRHRAAQEGQAEGTGRHDTRGTGREGERRAQRCGPHFLCRSRRANFALPATHRGLEHRASSMHRHRNIRQQGRRQAHGSTWEQTSRKSSANFSYRARLLLAAACVGGVQRTTRRTASHCSCRRSALRLVLARGLEADPDGSLMLLIWFVP